jgi:hypothetical protein
MDDIEMLKLENKGLRAQNKALIDEVRILRRYRQIIERSSAIVDNMPSAAAVTEGSPLPIMEEHDEPLFTMLAE